jgi:hypothetical protein
LSPGGEPSTVALEALVHGERTNAVLGWASTVVVAAAAVGSFLAGELLWGGLVLLVATVVSLPAVVTGDPFGMVPWPLPFLAAAAVVLGGAGFLPDVAGYVVIGSLALVLVVELDVYTGIELSRRFAVVFATMTTMALQALWIIGQFYSDRWLGTAFLQSQTELQWDIVYVTAVGVVLGVLAELYFRRFEPVGSFERPGSG